MTPRDRIHALLNGRPADRIPNGLGGCETAGLHNLAYHRLKNVLGVQDPRNRVCTFMANAVFEPSVLKAMEGDVILLASRMCPSRFWGPEAAREWKPLHIWDLDLLVANDWQFRRDPDGTWWWGHAMCPPGGLYFDAPAGQQVAAQFDDLPAPSPQDFHPSHDLPEPWLTRLAEDAHWLHENTPYAIACGEMIQDLQLRPGGTQAWWTRMISEPDACHEFLDKAVDAALAQLRQLHDAVGAYCCMLGIADDMGDKRGITIGPQRWRTVYKPHYKRLFDGWHRITNMKINLHTCGSMFEILEDLVECGVDLYNPVQVSAEGMDPAGLKQRFGDRLIFYGGAFDAAGIPPSASAETAYEAAKANIRALSRGGGYLFAGVHNLPGNLPEAHLQALMTAYRDCRDEPACRAPEWRRPDEVRPQPVRDSHDQAVG